MTKHFQQGIFKTVAAAAIACATLFSAGFSAYAYEKTGESEYRVSTEEIGEPGIAEKTVTLTEKQSAAVKNLDINWNAGHVVIQPAADKQIKIVQKSHVKHSESDQFVLETEDDTLLIRDPRNIPYLNIRSDNENGYFTTFPNVHGNNYWTVHSEQNAKTFLNYIKQHDTTLEIYLPAKSYEFFELYSTNREMENKPKTHWVTGQANYTVKKITADDVSGGTISGIMTLDNCTVKSIDLSCVNGTVDVKNSKTDAVTLSAVNGEVMISNTVPAKTCDMSAVNGDVIAVFTSVPADLKLDLSVVNGDVDVTLPKNIDGFIASRVNGDISCEFAANTGKRRVIYGNGNPNHDFSCVNGDISIYQGK